MNYIQNKLDEFDKQFIVKSNANTDLLRYTDANKIKHFINQSLTDYHNHIVEKVKNWFDSELENNKGDIKTYRNIHQDKEGILSLLQDTNPNE